MTNLIDDVEAASSPFLIYAKIAGFALVALAIAAGGWWARGVFDAPSIANLHTDVATAKGETQQCVAQHEKGRADGSDKVIAGLTAAAGDVTAAVADLNKKAGDRDAATNRFLKELANAPKTSICAGSPAELAYRHSVQPQPSP